MRPSTFLALALSSLAAAQKTFITDIGTFNPTLITLITSTRPTLTTFPTLTATIKPCKTTSTVIQTNTVLQTNTLFTTSISYTASTRTITTSTTATVTTTETVKPTSTGVHYDVCANPGWPISVIDFEYRPDYPNIADYRGLKWSNWAGFNYYPGYPDGWAPIPSNYTTGFTKTNGKEYELIISSGPRAKLTGLHSFWFYYFEAGVKPDAHNVIYVEGLSGGSVVYAVKLYTNTFEDGVWEHVCLDWNKIDTVRFVLQDCIKPNGCGGAWFEVDDLWVRGRGN